MSDHWPLLADLDELLAREDWQNDWRRVDELNRHITQETGISIETVAESLVAVWRWGFSDTPTFFFGSPPFLRSRDAAALLEETIYAELGPRGDLTTITLNGSDAVVQMTWRDPPHSTMPEETLGASTTEAAARTRAALEAGWELGLWPVSGPSALVRRP